MELGRGRLRRNGLNVLSRAVHAKHGLAWTDGKAVYLAPVTVIDDEVENDESIKLGEFDNVQSLHWSCDICATYCFLCVVHQGFVTLWRVSGSVPNLQLKQVRKIHTSPIPQGVLWSPNRDILCMLNRDQCSFYFRHIQNKGSFSLPPIESGKITAGCWSQDGERLIIGIGSIVLIYQWIDIDKSISEYTITAWKIPNVEGRICSVTSVASNRVVCAAELPLEALCTTENVFEVPDLTKVDDDKDLNIDKLGEDLIKPRKEGGLHKDNLFNLKKSVKLPLNDSSQLILFELQGQKLFEPCKLASTSIKGILAPDLIFYDAQTDYVVVGCNTQNVLQVFHLEPSGLKKVSELSLGKDERPKGICSAPVTINNYSALDGALVLVGKPFSSENSFLPMSMDADYELKLLFLPYGYHGNGGTQNSSPESLSIFKELQLPSGRSKVHLLRINPIQDGSKPSPNGHGKDKDSVMLKLKKAKEQDSGSGKSNKKKANVVSDVPKIDLLLPGNRSVAKTGISLVDDSGEEEGELETEVTDFGTCPPSFVGAAELNNGRDKHMESGTVNFADRLATFRNKLHLKNFLTHQHNVHSPEGAAGTPEESHIYGRPPGEVVSTDYGTLTHTSNTLGPSTSHHNGQQDLRLSDTDGAVVAYLQQQVASLEAQVRIQANQISAMQERIDEMSRLLEEGGSVATQRSAELEPQIVQLVWRSAEGKHSETKAFMLDRGRLLLESVKHAFGLLTVELAIDGVSCVLGANAEGFIPFKFTPHTTMHISGRKALEKPRPKTPAKPEHSQA